MSISKTASSSSKIKTKFNIALETFIKSIKAIKAHSTGIKDFDLIHKLKQEGINSPILLVGKQPLRIKRTISYLKDELFSLTSSDFSSYFGSEFSSSKSLTNITNDLKNYSLFSSFQVVVLYEADKIKTTIASELAKTIKEANNTSFLILAAESMNQRTPFLTALASDIYKIEVSELKGAALKLWIEKEAKRHKTVSGIEPSAIDLLVEVYASDLQTISSEIEKLALLTERESLITKSLTQNILSQSAEATSFQLLEHISKRNIPQSAKLIHTMLLQGQHPLQIAGFLNKAIRTALANKNRHDPYGLCSELSNHWFVLNLKSTIESFGTNELKRCLALLSKLDFGLKDNGLPHHYLISTCVDRMTSRQFLIERESSPTLPHTS